MGGQVTHSPSLGAIQGLCLPHYPKNEFGKVEARALLFWQQLTILVAEEAQLQSSSLGGVIAFLARELNSPKFSGLTVVEIACHMVGLTMFQGLL